MPATLVTSGPFSQLWSTQTSAHTASVMIYLPAIL